MEPLFSSAPPPDLPQHLRWRCVKVPKGINGPFLVAGPGWSGAAHYSAGRTLPCLKFLPGCRLSCPNCHKVRRFVCYLPLWSLKATKQSQVVIQGAKRTWQTFVSSKFGDMVNVIRGGNERDTPLIGECKLAEPTLDRSKFSRRGPQDLTRYLLHLWQWRELTESFGELFHASIRSLEIEDGTRSIVDDPPREFEAE